MRHWLAVSVITCAGCATGARGTVAPVVPDSTPYRQAALVAALRSFALAESLYRSGRAAYAPGPAALGWTGSDTAVRVIVLRADAAGWTAVAVDLRHPDDVCATQRGTAVLPWLRDAKVPLPACRSTSVLVPPETVAAAPTTERTEERPPEADCPPFQMTAAGRASLHGPETVTIRLVLDSTGKVEPGSLRLFGASSFWGAAMGLEMLADCRYTPGRVGGRRIRTLIQQPFKLFP